MKAILTSVAMAFQMFSVLPAPRVEWRQENMRYMLSALPLVGLVIALADWLWFLLCEWLELGSILFAAGLTLLPLLLSGGIHMDGFCDTVDALASHAPPARRREILKDPHAGAFAAMGAAGYLLLFAALCTELPRSAAAVWSVGLHQVFARALGALCSARFPSAGEGLQRTFRDAADRRAALALLVWALLCLGGLCALRPLAGALCALVYALCFLSLRRTAARSFGGMSGDLAGYVISLSALLMLLATILAEKAVTL